MANALHAHMTEDQLKERVITLAKARGWKLHHDRPAPDPRQGGEFRTVIEGDKGFPDLVLARDGFVIFVELKSETGRLGAGQREWLEALSGADDWQGEGDRVMAPMVALWRPSDWPTIEAVLQ